MLLGAANLIDRSMGDRKVNLVGRRTRRLGAESQIPEQVLGHPVMSLVLEQRSAALVGQTALPAEPGDETQLLERTEVGQGGRGSHSKAGRDVLESRTAGVVLSGRDHSKRFDLAMGQLLEGLHDRAYPGAVYIGHPNY
jgi:hypothetical protein